MLGPLYIIWTSNGTNEIAVFADVAVVWTPAPEGRGYRHTANVALPNPFLNAVHYLLAESGLNNLLSSYWQPNTLEARPKHEQDSLDDWLLDELPDRLWYVVRRSTPSHVAIGWFVFRIGLHMCCCQQAELDSAFPEYSLTLAVSSAAMRIPLLFPPIDSLAQLLAQMRPGSGLQSMLVVNALCWEFALAPLVGPRVTNLLYCIDELGEFRWLDRYHFSLFYENFGL
jgi:hypothetical protein